MFETLDALREQQPPVARKWVLLLDGFWLLVCSIGAGAVLLWHGSSRLTEAVLYSVGAALSFFWLVSDAQKQIVSEKVVGVRNVVILLLTVFGRPLADGIRLLHSF